MSHGSVSRRCSCKNPSTGGRFGKHCPKLRKKGHGSWRFELSVGIAADASRYRLRKSGYKTSKHARSDLDHVKLLLTLPKSERGRERLVGQLREICARHGAYFPTIEEVRRQLAGGPAIGSMPAVGPYLDAWLAAQRPLLAPNTFTSYSGHVENHLRPAFKDFDLDELRPAHVIEMFEDIEKRNAEVSANNDDRRALEARIRAAPTSPRTVRRELRAELGRLPPYRKVIGPASRQRIQATLRKALNDAISETMISFNAAAHVSIRYTKPKPLVWTPQRVREWRRTGCRPSPVMVWTPTQTGRFLDDIQEHLLYPLMQTAAYRGLRRGELCALGNDDLDDEDFEYVTVLSQLTEVDYEVEEGTPKSDASARTVTLDPTTGQALREHVAAQEVRRRAAGDAWIDSGRIFTKADGSALRPSSVSREFDRLVVSLNMPPIRFHDLRHVAATIALAAGVDMKVVQDMLGHSSLSVTSDLYTSVLPDLAAEAARATAATVPRAVRKPRRPQLAVVDKGTSTGVLVTHWPRRHDQIG